MPPKKKNDAVIKIEDGEDNSLCCYAKNWFIFCYKLIITCKSDCLFNLMSVEDLY